MTPSRDARGSTIPRAVLAAARRAGLSVPLGYVGGREPRDVPRKKTLADLESEVVARIDRRSHLMLRQQATERGGYD